MAVLAIIAALVTVGVVFVGGYIADARTVAKKQVLYMINDALNRYKTQGGGTTGFTVGASIGRVIRQLKTPVNWAGKSHQFLGSAATYSARSLRAVGSGAQYRFYSYDGYEGETPAAGTATSEQPFGLGTGYIAVNDGLGIYLKVTCSGASHWALQIGSAAPIITASGSWVLGATGTSGTFWACAGAADSTKAGNISQVDCNGGAGNGNPISNDNVSVLDVSGLTSLTQLRCYSNDLTSLNVKYNTALTYLHCSVNQLGVLDVSTNTMLTVLSCYSNQLSVLDIHRNGALTHLWCGYNTLGTLNLNTNTALTYIWGVAASLTSLTLPTEIDSLAGMVVYGNTALTGTADAINMFYGTLPNVSGGAVNNLYIGTTAPTSGVDDSIATNKGWTVSRTNP